MNIILPQDTICDKEPTIKKATIVRLQMYSGCFYFCACSQNTAMLIQSRRKVNSKSLCFGGFSPFSTPTAHYGLGYPLKSKMMTVWLEAMQWTTSHHNTLPPLKTHCQPISALKCMWMPPLSLLPLTTGHEPMERRDLPSPSCTCGTWCLGAWTGACST